MTSPGASSVIDMLRGGLVVSCQAYPGEPMRHPDTMRRVAQAAVQGGAVGIRAQGLDDVRAIRAVLQVPVIGLWKDGAADVVITPTLEHAVHVAEAGADVVALDGTGRARPDGRTLEHTIRELKRATGCLVMADCSTLQEGLDAVEFGADLIGTTLSGYTPYSTVGTTPDLDLVRALSASTKVPIVAEGRIHTPQQARDAISAGAWTVVVGTAITHPTTVTRWFSDAVRTEAAPPVSTRSQTRRPHRTDRRGRR